MNETDRELLELAARAEDRKWLSYHHTKGFCCRDNTHGGLIEYYWNPITEDGDALRLAVKLFHAINIFKTTESENSLHLGFIEVWHFEDDSDPILIEHLIPCGESLEEATRRAIVRAAAEIGRSMK